MMTKNNILFHDWLSEYLNNIVNIKITNNVNL